MLTDRDLQVKQEQYKDLRNQAEFERLVSLAARKADKQERKQEKAHERQPAPQREGGLVLQLRRLMSFLL